jgi:glutathione S-transferase
MNMGMVIGRIACEAIEQESGEKSAMLTVHHLGVSQSERIVWLCEELAIPYELRRYDRDPATRLAPADYQAIHAFGTAPVITDGDRVLAETGAIIEYIIGRYGGGRLAVGPAGANYPEYLHWFHFANGSLMPAMMIELVGNAMSGGQKQELTRALGVRSDRAYKMMEARLSAVDYFAGAQFTAADVMMVFPLTTMRLFAPRDLGAYPNIRAYLKRIGERPAYQRAMKKADPNLAPQLT